jgi:hypothetical protein
MGKNEIQLCTECHVFRARLYYNEQVLKFSIHRRILKSHIYIYICVDLDEFETWTYTWINMTCIHRWIKNNICIQINMRCIHRWIKNNVCIHLDRYIMDSGWHLIDGWMRSNLCLLNVKDFLLLKPWAFKRPPCILANYFILCFHLWSCLYFLPLDLCALITSNPHFYLWIILDYLPYFS